MPNRRIARAAAAAPARASAAGGSTPSTSNRVIAGVRLIRSAPPGKAISPLAASRSARSSRPARTGRGRGGERRASRRAARPGRAPARSGASLGARLGALDAARLRQRLAHDLDAQLGAFGDSGGIGSTSASSPPSSATMPRRPGCSIVDQPRLDDRAGAEARPAARSRPRRSRRPRPGPRGSRRSLPRKSHSAKRPAGGAQQRAGLEERQAHHPRMAARQHAHQRLGAALDRIAAGLAAPFAAGEIGGELVLAEPLEGDDRWSTGGGARVPSASITVTAERTRWRRPDSSVSAARASASLSVLGRMRRPAATTVSAASTSAPGSRATAAPSRPPSGAA